MQNKSLDRAAIVQQLAAKLPDSLLEKLFPGIAPIDIRNVLSEKQESTRAIAQQQTLFGEKSPQSKQLSMSCKLFTDGASRGNPGEAGAGIVLLDQEDQEVAARTQYLGQCTNNVAEYKALLLGLETAKELHCSKLSIFMDSQLIVRQITGQYKVKNASLKPLFTRARDLLKNFGTWSIDHVPRAQNKRADELANQGADNKN